MAAFKTTRKSVSVPSFWPNPYIYGNSSHIQRIVPASQPRTHYTPSHAHRSLRFWYHIYRIAACRDRGIAALPLGTRGAGPRPEHLDWSRRPRNRHPDQNLYKSNWTMVSRPVFWSRCADGVVNGKLMSQFVWFGSVVGPVGKGDWYLGGRSWKNEFLGRYRSIISL